jgi:hypothetical protein
MDRDLFLLCQFVVALRVGELPLELPAKTTERR